MSVAEWVPNLARRLAQLDSISGLDNLNNIEVWLGGLFFPEAYITATRQAVAHRKKWSLETLHMQLDIDRVNDPEAFILDGKLTAKLQSFRLTFGAGLVLEGASWSTERLQLELNEGESVRLNPSQIRWVQSNEPPSGSVVNLPVYLNNDRSDVLFTIDLLFDSSAGALVATRAVCLTA